MRRTVGAVVALIFVAAACGRDLSPERLTVYSGRSEELVGALIETFETQTGIVVDVRYGDTAELAAAIAEEGDRSPADVFWAQDAGALGSLAADDIFQALPSDIIDGVDAGFRSAQGLWVGTSGRARVLVYNTTAVDDPPSSVFDLTDARWRGKVGWAPTNGSFQAFVTAMRVVEGEDATERWLRAMAANGAQAYASNTPIVQAVASGEIDAGLVNHYYLLELSEQDAGLREAAANHFFAEGDVGNLVNVAGVGVLASAGNSDAALELVRFLRSDVAAEYFATTSFEYPLSTAVDADDRLPALADLGAPELDLSDLADLRGTLRLLRDTGVL